MPYSTFSLPKDLYDKGALSQRRMEFLQSFTMLVNIFISPIVIYLFYKGVYSLALIEMTFIGLINVKTYCISREQPCVISYSHILFVMLIAYVWATYLLGPAVALWTYPTFAALYFVTPTKKAHLITLAFVLPINTVMFFTTDLGFTLRYLGSIVCLMYLANKIVEIITHLQVSLLDSSIKDPLTGAYNRRHMNCVLAKHIKAYSREQQPMSLLVIDIDHFKQVNDRFGHDAGDQVLQLVVNKITHMLRANDLVFRMGGEEFIILFPNTKADNTLMLAEKIRQELALIKINNVEHNITVSIGVAAYKPEYNKDAWLKAADECLYKAKKQGRNQVISCHCV